MAKAQGTKKAAVESFNMDALVALVHENLTTGEDAIKITKKAVGQVVKATFEGIATGLERYGLVKIAKFGTFKVREREGRMGRNPQTGEELEIAPSKNVGFKNSSTLKGRVGGSVE